MNMNKTKLSWKKFHTNLRSYNSRESDPCIPLTFDKEYIEKRSYKLWGQHPQKPFQGVHTPKWFSLTITPIQKNHDLYIYTWRCQTLSIIICLVKQFWEESTKSMSRERKCMLSTINDSKHLFININMVHKIRIIYKKKTIVSKIKETNEAYIFILL